MTDIRTYLQSNLLLFDGAMGTYWVATHRSEAGSCELANLTHPEEVTAIHRAYLDAGCQAIKTNTFAANAAALESAAQVEAVISAAWRCAQRAAAGRDAYVFADIGPIPQTRDAEPWEGYREVLDCFLALGAKHFLFETHSSDVCLAQCAAYIKERDPDAFVLVSFAVQPDGFTREGRSGQALLQTMAQCSDVDAVGFNCVSGAYHMRQLVQGMNLEGEALLSAMPNAGYPVVASGRTFYDSDPAYYVLQLSELAGLGVKILGGCCGTTPEHLRRTARLLAQRKGTAVKRISPDPPARRKKPRPNRLQEKFRSGGKVLAVELDPPKTTELGKFMSGAWTLREAGADVITISDCPIGRARMDSSLLACKLRRELGIDPLPHMTCRDRNLNATKALLLGLSVEGVDNVLVITGDPIPSAERDEVKSVFNFNSRKLADFIRTLNETELEQPFSVFGALNVNARNFGVELRRARQKVEAGMCGFLTQPVLSKEGLDNLKLAWETLDAHILGGIIPVVSHRNGVYMNSEINGISVCQEILDLYEGKDRAEGEELAVKISTAIAGELAPYVDGYYLMTPFQRVGLMVRIMDGIRAEG
ncbi:MAG: bifunctional homocysteine S-methyltransferase/methylenetetrahydrofolate reductase [Clostridiales bacterium]|nr:bifunctional homocysteine S-methyltransferase/methylenetetrahydrofolate reductase [Clostridiales bacterium]